jgi:hypothetical protein
MTSVTDKSFPVFVVHFAKLVCLGVLTRKHLIFEVCMCVAVIKDGSIVCFFGYHCMNHENSPELGYPRRILWAKLIFLERPDLLNFAKRQPLVQTLDAFNSSDLGASTAADVGDVLSDPCVSPSLSGDYNFSSTGPGQNCTGYISIPGVFLPFYSFPIFLFLSLFSYSSLSC